MIIKKKKKKIEKNFFTFIYFLYYCQKVSNYTNIILLF